MEQIATRTRVGLMGPGHVEKVERSYRPDKINGIVSQSAGVPTGAVIERGSNANGDYVRLADGTQICTVANFAPMGADSATGSIFRGDSTFTWTFPIAFSVPPVVTGSARAQATRWLALDAPTVAAVEARPYSAVSSDTAYGHDLTAIGRWF